MKRSSPCPLGSAERPAFSLIELLVVVSIVAMLMAILLPALKIARVRARVVSDLSNLRQIGIGMAAYRGEHQGCFPMHSSSSTGPWPGFDNRPRWPDYIYAYLNDPEVFLSPLLSERELTENFQKPFAHDVSLHYGGYGYNYQYLGNSRFSPSFHAAEVPVPAETVVVGDTAGSRGGYPDREPGDAAEAVYVLDPPLASALGGAPDGRAYYPTASVEEPAGTPQTYRWRSFPAERGGTDPAFALADGHAVQRSVREIDDYDADGVNDNGYWNRDGDPGAR